MQKVTLGQGKKTDVAPKDLLFTVLCILKAATNQDSMSEIFKEKGPTLQRLFSCEVDLLSPLLYQNFVNHYYSKLSMVNLIKKGTQFKNFPYALYATNVIFQQGICPSKTMLSVANTICMATKLKCLWPQQNMQSMSQTINLAASLTWLFFNIIVLSIIKCSKNI